MLGSIFQITVDSAIKIHDNLVSVGGPCINRRKFTAPLIDDAGNVYDAHIPMGKTLVFDDSRIMLGIYGKYDIESLKGLTLKSFH